MATTKETAAAVPENDKVTIHLFKDNDKYSGDVFVGVNGKNWLIKRGEDVEVPRCVAEVIKNAEAQRNLAIDGQNELSDEFEAKTKNISGK